MKVAVYGTSREWMRHMASCFRLCEELIGPIEVDLLDSETRFWHALGKEHYDLVMLCGLPGRLVSRGRLLKYLERLWGEMSKAETRYVWRFGRKQIILAESEIYYIRSIQKEVSVHTARCGYRISTNMKREEERLSGDQFLRIHRDCMVNLAHVHLLDGDQLWMKNGEALQISIRRRKKVREELHRFGVEKMGAGNAGEGDPGAKDAGVKGDGPSGSFGRKGVQKLRKGVEHCGGLPAVLSWRGLADILSAT